MCGSHTISVGLLKNRNQVLFHLEILVKNCPVQRVKQVSPLHAGIQSVYPAGPDTRCGGTGGQDFICAFQFSDGKWCFADGDPQPAAGSNQVRPGDAREDQFIQQSEARERIRQLVRRLETEEGAQ